MINPTAFISYAWESDELKLWVKQLSKSLRNDGVDVKLDQWELVPGDQTPHFMEKSVRDNDYVLIICSPKYKFKSENRIGGVGYEGDIMTAEVLLSSNHRKFIPILKIGSKDTAIPTWLSGKYYIDFTTEESYKANYRDLITTLLGNRELPPKLGPISNGRVSKKIIAQKDTSIENEDESIKIKGIIIDEVTEPKNDGTAGSALYKIPFELSSIPSSEWIELFIEAWDRPPRFTTMHRPGIASVYGRKIILNGTTIEEVEKYHKDTLKLSVEQANKQLAKLNSARELQTRRMQLQREEHKKRLDEISGRISFDD